MIPDEQDVQEFIEQAFEENFERLREESGRSVNPSVKQAAREQVMLYWAKLQEVAKRVTETEVKLILPEQTSPGGQRFTLEGVVDIVREDEQTIMYDIKTHLDAEAAADDLERHEKQLNVYAHIWHNLRGQALNQAAIIATMPTPELRYAIDTAQPERIAKALEDWDPVLEIPMTEETVQGVIDEFGEVVDCIEEHRFAPPPLETLHAPARPNGRIPFATAVCRNCDARFTCNSYRQYAVQSRQNQRPEAALKYYLEDYGNDQERNQWLDANMETLNRNRFGDEG